MQSWGFFLASNGNELTRGWQGHEDKARARAQAFADDLGEAVEFAPEGALSDGEVVEPRA